MLIPLPFSDTYSQPDISSYSAPTVVDSYSNPAPTQPQQSPSYLLTKNSDGPLSFIGDSLQNSPLFNAFQVRKNQSYLTGFYYMPHVISRNHS